MKRSTLWVGYKVHLTEICDESSPHLIVNVETTLATVSDHNILPALHTSLAKRDLCTRAKSEPRYLRIRPSHERMKQLRAQEQTEEWKTLYQERAGIEETISQSLRVTGLRQTRYRGLAKTQLQDLLSASAINLI